MAMKCAYLLIGLIAVIVSGCSTPLKSNQVRYTLDSSPPGAMIYEGDKSWGQAPVTLISTGSEESVKNGYVLTGKMTAIWPSGARKTNNIKMAFNAGDRYFKFSRPPDAPGLDKDLVYANQLNRTSNNGSGSNDAAWEAVGRGMSDYGNSQKNMANQQMNQPSSLPRPAPREPFATVTPYTPPKTTNTTCNYIGTELRCTTR